MVGAAPRRHEGAAGEGTHTLAHQSRQNWRVEATFGGTESLPSLFSGDNTGSFAGKGKLAFWKAFREASGDEVKHLENWISHQTPATPSLLSSKSLSAKITCQVARLSQLEAEMFFVHKEADAA